MDPSCAEVIARLQQELFDWALHPNGHITTANDKIAAYADNQLQVTGGVLIGISFFLLNNVFGYVGNLRNWWPWLTAAAPGLLYSLLSLGAFTWLVLRR